MSNDELADIACFSPCHFNRIFRRITGIPPVQFHYALRLERAKRLLVTTDLGITEICLAVGYNSLGTFASRFNELVGVSPGAFRRFGRRVAADDLAELRPHLATVKAASGCEHIVGRIESPDGFEGFVLVGLFRRAIPEGRPARCALLANAASYSVSFPPAGVWYAFAVGVPSIAKGMQLLTLDNVVRGRSGAIRVEGDRWSGDSTIVLRPPNVIDPPILAAVPLLVMQMPSTGASAPTAGTLLNTWNRQVGTAKS